MEENFSDDSFDDYLSADEIDIDRTPIKAETKIIPDNPDLFKFQQMRIKEIAEKKRLATESYFFQKFDISSNINSRLTYKIVETYDIFSIIVCFLYERCEMCRIKEKYCYHLGGHDYAKIINMSKTCKRWYEFGKRFLSGKDIVLVDIENTNFLNRLHYGFKERVTDLLLTEKNGEVLIEPRIKSVCICHSREWRIITFFSSVVIQEEPEVAILTRGIHIKGVKTVTSAMLTLKDIKTRFKALYPLTSANAEILNRMTAETLLTLRNANHFISLGYKTYAVHGGRILDPYKDRELYIKIFNQ